MFKKVKESEKHALEKLVKHRSWCQCLGPKTSRRCHSPFTPRCDPDAGKNDLPVIYERLKM